MVMNRNGAMNLNAISVARTMLPEVRKQNTVPAVLARAGKQTIAQVMSRLLRIMLGPTSIWPDPGSATAPMNITIGPDPGIPNSKAGRTENVGSRTNLPPLSRSPQHIMGTAGPDLTKGTTPL